jgi:diguanylate cyclase (GGDEF)-like protein
LIAAERLRRVVENSSASEGMPVTVSIGVATSPTDATSLSALFVSADTRLYDAKFGGRNRVVGRTNGRPQSGSTNGARSIPGVV